MSHSRLRFGLALGLLALASTAQALDPRKSIHLYSLTSWTDSDGLPNNTVQRLAQSADGYLWVATLEGLTRFDGQSFRTFDRSNTAAIGRPPVPDLQHGGCWQQRRPPVGQRTRLLPAALHPCQ